MSSLNHKSFDIIETKADGDHGWFEATVAVFGNVDHGGDRIIPGAFDKTLRDWRKTGDPIPIILSHNWNDPFAHVGVADPKDVKPTAKGLLLRGKLDVEDNEVARQVYKLMQRRSLKEFSFGYSIPRGGARRAKDGANDLREVNLVEAGPTLRGMNPETELHAVKSALGLVPDSQRQRETVKRLERAFEEEGLPAVPAAPAPEPPAKPPIPADLNVDALPDLSAQAAKAHDLALAFEREEEEARIPNLPAAPPAPPETPAAPKADPTPAPIAGEQDDRARREHLDFRKRAEAAQIPDLPPAPPEPKAAEPLAPPAAPEAHAQRTRAEREAASFRRQMDDARIPDVPPAPPAPPRAKIARPAPPPPTKQQRREADRVAREFERAAEEKAVSDYPAAPPAATTTTDPVAETDALDRCRTQLSEILDELDSDRPDFVRLRRLGRDLLAFTEGALGGMANDGRPIAAIRGHVRALLDEADGEQPALPQMRKLARELLTLMNGTAGPNPKAQDARAKKLAEAARREHEEQRIPAVAETIEAPAPPAPPQPPPEDPPDTKGQQARVKRIEREIEEQRVPAVPPPPRNPLTPINPKQLRPGELARQLDGFELRDGCVLHARAVLPDEHAGAKDGLLKAVWSAAYVNSLPDSAFLYVENGTKDSEGKTTPRSLRHFPYKDADGNVDVPHLRNAISRIPQSSLPQATKDRLLSAARRTLTQQSKADATDEATNGSRSVDPLRQRADAIALEHASDGESLRKQHQPRRSPTAPPPLVPLDDLKRRMRDEMLGALSEVHD